MARAGFWAIESEQIRFGKDGRWYSGDDVIENPRIAGLFSRHVQRADDGTFWLVSGDERARIVVEDTPYVVTRVDGAPAQGFTIRLNDDSVEPLEVATLRVAAATDVLYCDVKQGRHAARFLRPSQAELLTHARPDGNGFALAGPGGRAQPIRVVSTGANESSDGAARPGSDGSSGAAAAAQPRPRSERP